MYSSIGNYLFVKSCSKNIWIKPHYLWDLVPLQPELSSQTQVVWHKCKCDQCASSVEVISFAVIKLLKYTGVVVVLGIFKLLCYINYNNSNCKKKSLNNEAIASCSEKYTYICMTNHCSYTLLMA